MWATSECPPDQFGPTCEACDCRTGGSVQNICSDGVDGDGTCTCDVANFNPDVGCINCFDGFYGPACEVPRSSITKARCQHVPRTGVIAPEEQIVTMARVAWGIAFVLLASVLLLAVRNVK